MVDAIANLFRKTIRSWVPLKRGYIPGGSSSSRHRGDTALGTAFFAFLVLAFLRAFFCEVTAGLESTGGSRDAFFDDRLKLLA
jgi:hypothetical protein